MTESTRWDRLFADLEAEAEMRSRLELEGEVAERTRISRAEVGLTDRLHAQAGVRLVVRTLGGGRVQGAVAQAGEGWLLLRTPTPVLIASAAVSSIVGLGREAVGTSVPMVSRTLSLRHVLRAVLRDRSPVTVLLVDGDEVTGTLDVVGRDHVDLAEHPLGELRRSRAVRAVRTVPLGSLALLRPDPGTSSLQW